MKKTSLILAGLLTLIKGQKESEDIKSVGHRDSLEPPQELRRSKEAMIEFDEILGRNLEDKDKESVARLTATKGGGSSKDGEITSGEMPEFLTFAAQSNKYYGTDTDLQMRFKIWRENDKLIKQQNADAAKQKRTDPIKLRHNKFSDLTKEELKKMFGKFDKSN